MSWWTEPTNTLVCHEGIVKKTHVVIGLSWVGILRILNLLWVSFQIGFYSDNNTTSTQVKRKKKYGKPIFKTNTIHATSSSIVKNTSKKQIERIFFLLISNYFIGISHPVPFNLFDDSFTKLTQLSKKNLSSNNFVAKIVYIYIRGLRACRMDGCCYG